MSVDLTAVRAPRPHRADAARNFDAVLAAAQEVFTEFGADAPLDEVARRAGVGIATLYRNFPTREHLIENVFLTEVDAVCRFAGPAAEMDPWTGITTWLRRFIDLIATKRAVATGLDHDSPGYRAAAEALDEAGGPLLQRAQEAGTFRDDVDIDGVLRMIMAFAAVNFSSPEQRDRMLEVAFDGLTRAAKGQGSRQG
jgi:AcrR family transcriptional regulator